MWKLLSNESDLISFLNREKAKARAVSAGAGAMTGSSDVRFEILEFLALKFKPLAANAFFNTLALTSSVEKVSLMIFLSYNVTRDLCNKIILTGFQLFIENKLIMFR